MMVSEQKMNEAERTKPSAADEFDCCVGAEEMQVAELMQKLGLRDRKNFREVYLGPSIKEGFVRLLYPNSPRHPRQRYLLTVKGLGLLRLLETKGELQ